LELSGLATGNEQGFLGLAFHPDYANNGLFYVNFTATGGSFNNGVTHVRQYRVLAADPNVANTRSAETLLTYDQPFSNHNAGWLGFGPNDGYLYIATGDGGSANDPGNRAQDVTNQRLGKMLRIDVDGDNGPGGNFGIPDDNPFVGATGDDEIWAYGLRNPWRPSFDRQTGDLLIADVGQNAREEVNFQPADSSGGENYGWRVMEGNRCNINGDALPCSDPSFVVPIHEYSHTGDPTGGFSITGGYVYRGDAIEGLGGTYFFADFVTSQIWSFHYADGVKSEFTNRTQELAPDAGSFEGFSSFAEDAAGELYILSLGGDVFKLVEPVLGDTDGDGDVDIDDITNVRNNFGTRRGGLGDTDKDRDVDIDDLNNVRNNFGAGVARAVPEPASALLLGVAVVAGVFRCRRRSS
jgi:hypothetical protein